MGSRVTEVLSWYEGENPGTRTTPSGTAADSAPSSGGLLPAGQAMRAGVFLSTVMKIYSGELK